MMMNSYPFGSTVILTAVFKTIATKILYNPATVLLRVLDPAGLETVYTLLQLSNSSTGVFVYDLNPLVPGIWTYRWEGSGAVGITAEQKFNVQPSAFSFLNSLTFIGSETTDIASFAG